MAIVEDIGLITTFLLVFLAVFLLTATSKNKRSNVLFALFLLVTSLDLSALFLGSVYQEYRHLNQLRVASVLLQMPLFYFYVKSICYHNFRLEPRQLLHSTLFFCFLALFAIGGLSDQNYLWYQIVAQIQYYGYIIGVIFILRRYRQLQLENYSLQNKTYQWLMTTTLLFLTGNCFVLLRSVYDRFFDHSDFMTFLNLGISLFGLAVISWFVLKTMRSPELFRGIDQGIKPLEKGKVEAAEKYKTEIDALTQYMATQKPYLEEDLSLQGLAQKTEIPEKHLSFLINKVQGKHFFDFINTYRIQEAKALLQKEELNIQQIMYEVGFNSKSSFNTAFKKYTSTTPSKYRKSIR